MIQKLTEIMLFLSLILLTGCSSKKDTITTEYKTISASEAYDIMTQESDITILDVRTKEEYDTGHIANSILLPYDQISNQTDSTLCDKDAKILIYCRSGRRSAIAAKELASLGYTNVYDFGGIIDWPYETTTN